MIARHIVPEITVALRDTPVLFLNGSRQTGKSTLAQQLINIDGVLLRYLTLDDAAILSAAQDDAPGFVAGLTGPVVIDEVQRAPGLFLAIKAAVDRDRKPGRFLLTGSADIMLLPSLSDSLAGRTEIFTLWPLSQAEIEGHRENLPDIFFSKSKLPSYRSTENRKHLIDRLIRGGYPVIQQRESEARRRAWFGSYLTTILQRDVRDFSNIDDLAMMPKLLDLLATRVCGLLNFADVSRSIAIPQTTLKRYFMLLETTFLVQTLHPWAANLGKRLVKSPKIYLNDTGLMAYLLGLNAQQLATSSMIGPMIENFVIMEIRKQIGWSETRARMYHFRTHAGDEVDLVLEDGSGALVAIEVKASSTITASDLKGIRAFEQMTGARFRRGIVFYTGTETVPFAKNIHAVPIQALWAK